MSKLLEALGLVAVAVGSMAVYCVLVAVSWVIPIWIVLWFLGVV